MRDVSSNLTFLPAQLLLKKYLFRPELVRMSEKRYDRTGKTPRKGRGGAAGERGGAAAIKLHY